MPVTLMDVVLRIEHTAVYVLSNHSHYIPEMGCWFCCCFEVPQGAWMVFYSCLIPLRSITKYPFIFNTPSAQLLVCGKSGNTIVNKFNKRCLLIISQYACLIFPELER